MRTTLKGGIGRLGGPGGNGHSVLTPALGPVTRYRQPDPPKRQFVELALRGLGWFVLALLVLVAGIAGGLFLYAHESLNAVEAKGSVKKAEQRLAAPVASQPAIALVAGYDHRAGTGSSSYAGSNSDTLMLLRADPTNHTLSLLSLPRDLYIPIYCRGNTPFTTDRINSAWAHCGNDGPLGVVDTMEHLTHLRINYLITLDFRAFKQIVNRLHGVYMNVDRRYYIPLHTGVSAINLQPGYQKLDGGQALEYVRFRHFDSDIYRTGRQQLFIEALKNRLKQTFSIFELPGLIGSLKRNIEVARGGGGAVTLSELESYLGLAYHLPPGHLLRDQIPITELSNYTTPGGADVLQAAPGAIAGAVHSFLHPAIRASEALNVQFLGHRKTNKGKKQHKLAKSRISVLVLNAGTVAGKAANTTYLLTRRGYTANTLPSSVPADTPKVQRETTVYFDPVQPDAKQAAQQLRPLFGPYSRVAQMTTAIATFAKQAGNPLTVVAVGTSFSGQLTVPHVVTPPPRQPPQVSSGFSVAAPALRSVARKAHFPLTVPYRIAQYSTLSQEEGVRAFKPLKNQHEVALTFLMPNGIAYWQIEETTWNTAPILANPTGQFFYQHHKLLLYTAGGAIQMVVLKTPRASYWVINTILNQLSNSTMIAIAKSLKPLYR
jgi:LCP family protein required for cell wall assembly